MEKLQFASLVIGLVGGTLGAVAVVVEWIRSRDRVSVSVFALVPADRRAVSGHTVSVVNTGNRAVAVTFVAFRRCGLLRPGPFILGAIEPPAGGWPVVVGPGMVSDFAVRGGGFRDRALGPCRPVVRIATGRFFAGARIADPARHFRVGREPLPAEPQSVAAV